MQFIVFLVSCGTGDASAGYTSLTSWASRRWACRRGWYSKPKFDLAALWLQSWMSLCPSESLASLPARCPTPLPAQRPSDDFLWPFLGSSGFVRAAPSSEFRCGARRLLSHWFRLEAAALSAVWRPARAVAAAAAFAAATGVPMAAGVRLRPLRAALLAAQLLAGIAGWSAAGHARIAPMAQSLLKGKHRAEARELLGGDMVDFAGWEAEMSAKRPETAALHWHRQVPEWSCSSGLGIDGKVHCNNKEAADDSMLCVLALTFKKYSHDAVLREYPHASDPLWDFESTFDWKDYIKDHHFEGLFSSATAELRWVVNLIGDMHQPMHWMQQYDYGRNIKVNFRGQEYDLLSFWEDYIPTQLPSPPTQMELDQQYSSRIQSWVNVAPGELFRTWAKESATQLCYRVYGALDLSNTSATVSLSDEVFQRWRSHAADSMSRAAQRTAFVLLDLLEHRRHREAHKDGRGMSTRHSSTLANLFKNAAIAAIVVPALLLALRWHDQTADRAESLPYGALSNTFGIAGRDAAAEAKRN